MGTSGAKVTNLTGFAYHFGIKPCRKCTIVGIRPSTQTWKERAGSYTISGSYWGAHNPETFKRSIEDYMYLRPIPQGQLNGIDMTDAEKAAYQNPGYPTE